MDQPSQITDLAVELIDDNGVVILVSCNANIYIARKLPAGHNAIISTDELNIPNHKIMPGSSSAFDNIAFPHLAPISVANKVILSCDFYFYGNYFF